MDFELAFQFYGVETFNLYKLRDNFLNAKANCDADEILLNLHFYKKISEEEKPTLILYCISALMNEVFRSTTVDVGNQLKIIQKYSILDL